jgi:LmbE family N-acetylglucosaminyl deacetylase
MKVKDSFDEIFGSLNKVLVVMAHPDDMEITCGGLVARLTDVGKKVRLVVTTNGGKGMQDKKGFSENDFGQARSEEQLKAGEILGIPQRENFNLQFPDGEVSSGIESIEKIVFHIREFKPDIVITHNPEDIIVHFFEKSSWVNHHDHRNTGTVTIDALYPYSRDRGFFPEHFEKGMEQHTVTKLLLTDSYVKPQCKYFQIDKYASKKRAALQQHLSAFSPEDASDFVEENKIDDHYFEPLGFYEVY